MKLSEIFRTNLKFFLQLRSMNQTQLAKKMGVSKVQVGRLYTGKNTPTLETLESISEALEIPADLLIWDKDEEADFVSTAKDALDTFRLAQLFSADDKFDPKPKKKVAKKPSK